MEKMKKFSILCLIIGEVKTGKTYLALTAPDSILVDMTADCNGRAAAFTYYREEFDRRYFSIEESDKELMRVIEENNGARSICIDEGSNLRDAFARLVLEELNAERKKDKPLKTIYPVTEWKRVYDDIESRLFREYYGIKNIIVTENMKDRYEYKEGLKKEVITKRVASGLVPLPILADVILRVVNEDVTVGSPPKTINRRKIYVLANRFLDFNDPEVWVNEVTSIPDLIEKICEKGEYEREVFV